MTVDAMVNVLAAAVGLLAGALVVVDAARRRRR